MAATQAMKLFRRMEGGKTAFEVKIHRIAADGAAVLTERTDALIIGPLRLQFWVCGVFEVHDGRITLWRDYFDFFDMFKATARGLAGLVLPSLKATFYDAAIIERLIQSSKKYAKQCYE